MSWIEKATEQARADGVRHPENFPYLLLPEAANGHGVLIIHGFGATPREVRPLAEALCKCGFTVAGIRLPGHGTSPRDLKKRHAQEWLNAAASGYQALADMKLTVSICGLSTGAIIALFVAARHPVERLLLLAPFLRLRHRMTQLAGMVSPFLLYRNRAVATDDHNFYYTRLPLKGVAQINHLLRKLPHILPQIDVPTLTLTSTGDATIAPGTATALHQLLGSGNKSIHIYGDDVPHVLTTKENPRLDDVLQRCTDFLESGTAD